MFDLIIFGIAQKQRVANVGSDFFFIFILIENFGLNLRDPFCMKIFSNFFCGLWRHAKFFDRHFCICLIPTDSVSKWEWDQGVTSFIKFWQIVISSSRDCPNKFWINFIWKCLFLVFFYENFSSRPGWDWIFDRLWNMVIWTTAASLHEEAIHDTKIPLVTQHVARMRAITTNYQ